MQLLRNLQDISRLAVFLGIVFPFFTVQYYLLATLVGTRDNTCIVGGYLTWDNIVFAGCMALCFGIFVVNIFILIQKNLTKHLTKISGLSGFGVLMTVLATMCPVCIISVGALGSIGIALQFISTHHWFVQLIGFISMAYGLIKLEKLLTTQCNC